jgi:hypothetical protein
LNENNKENNDMTAAGKTPKKEERCRVDLPNSELFIESPLQRANVTVFPRR